MINKVYRDMVNDILDRLPGRPIRMGQRNLVQISSPKPIYEHKLLFPRDDPRTGFKIVYRSRDLYIVGFRTSKNREFRFGDAEYEKLMPEATRLPFDGTYGGLGWDRSSVVINQGKLIVDVETLDRALTNANSRAVTKKDMLPIVIALAEGVRFMDVERAVRAKGRITSEMVDWGKQLEAENAKLKKA